MGEELLEYKDKRDFASDQRYRGSGKEKEIAGSGRYYDSVRTSKVVPGNRLEKTSSL